MARRTKRTARARATFLKILEETCNVTAAARAAGMGRTAVYDWRDEDESFARDWHNAEQAAVDQLEQVAFERAKAGHSDRMLEILLKAHRRKYIEKYAHEHGITPETADSLEKLGVTIEEASRLYREKLG